MNNTLYKIKRNYFKRKLIGNLGKIIETEDKIICYVNKNKCKKDKYDYTINCNSRNDTILAKYYNLDKPIIYIIEDLDFKKNVFIWGNNCEVIIKNCKFNLGLYTRINGICTLDNSTIIGFSYLNISADKVTIKNMNITNQLPYAIKNYTICIGADENIEINNSTIGDNTSHVYIIANNKLEVYKSNIVGKTVKCQSNKIIFGKTSSITAKEKTILETSHHTDINITSKTIICNDKIIETESPSVILKPIPSSLTTQRKELIKLLNSKRTELIQVLTKIKNNANNCNEEDLNEYKYLLKKRHIKEILNSNQRR